MVKNGLVALVMGLDEPAQQATKPRVRGADERAQLVTWIAAALARRKDNHGTKWVGGVVWAWEGISLSRLSDDRTL